MSVNGNNINKTENSIQIVLRTNFNNNFLTSSHIFHDNKLRNTFRGVELIFSFKKTSSLAMRPRKSNVHLTSHHWINFNNGFPKTVRLSFCCYWHPVRFLPDAINAARISLFNVASYISRANSCAARHAEPTDEGLLLHLASEHELCFSMR